MGFLIVIISLIMPRFVLIFIAIVTDWISQSFEDGMLWPFLGWMFMPYTTLAYMAAMLENDHQLSGGWIVLMIVAVLFDLGGQGSSVSSSSE